MVMWWSFYVREPDIYGTCDYFLYIAFHPVWLCVQCSNNSNIFGALLGAHEALEMVSLTAIKTNVHAISYSLLNPISNGRIK